MNWSELNYLTDPGVGEQITTLEPVLSIAFYMRVPELAFVSELHQAIMSLIGSQLTHYQAEAMKRPERISGRALEMIPAWLRKPRVTHRYWWSGNGGEDLGCGAPGYELFLMPLPEVTSAQKQQAIANFVRIGGVGEIKIYDLGSEIRVGLPVDHPLSHGDHLLEWLGGLELIRSGAVSFAEASYGLWSLAAPFGGETERRERALCSRYIGLDCFRLAHHNGMYRVDPAHGGFIPLVKRAAWTTVLHELTVAFLGGEEKLRHELAGSSQIRVIRLGRSLAIQTAARPDIGDVNEGDLLPLRRKVARVLRPARATRLADRDEFWDHFFNAFDKDYS